ncbi:hypothetical protein ACQP1O_18720 [Nocardia sp. CA-151230]|uniref:hypothetical protein n=1 Tax=Nocardia sp. CA-151230 TaxID=3239982 RepID=UPI003D91186D
MTAATNADQVDIACRIGLLRGGRLSLATPRIESPEHRATVRRHASLPDPAQCRPSTCAGLQTCSRHHRSHNRLTGSLAQRHRVRYSDCWRQALSARLGFRVWRGRSRLVVEPANWTDVCPIVTICGMLGVGANHRVRELLSGVCAIAAVGVVSTAPAAQANTDVASCADGWQVDTLASNLGDLENLEPDGNGGFFVSGIVNGVIYHVDSSNRVTTLLTDLDHPAGLRLVGNDLYFLTGNSTSLTGTGTLQRYNVAAGTVTTALTGLVQPDGLLLLPDGDLLIAHLSVPVPVGISRYRPSTGEFTPHWSNTPYPNGIALSPDRDAIYTQNEFTSQVLRIPLDAPTTSTVVATVHDGIIPFLDDMEATRSGQLYITGDYSGSVYHIDPNTGATCTIATGMQTSSPIPPNGPTSVRIAPDGDGWALYVVGVDGNLRRLRPPAGVDVTPVFADTDVDLSQ